MEQVTPIPARKALRQQSRNRRSLRKFAPLPPAGHDPLPGGRVKGAFGAAARAKTAKLRVGRDCREAAFWRGVEFVGTGAGAGEEAQPCPFAELGEHVPGF